MRFCFVLLIAVTSCNSNNNVPVKKDMGGGGFICPDHPENCEGSCCGEKCINTSVDVNNCGACNAACSGGTVCMGGKCGCLPSGAPCSMAQTCCPNKGCINLMTDSNNCGGCGKSCGDGATCLNGSCSCGGSTCGATQVCCGGNCQATCNVPTPDMAMSGGMPLCDCTGLSKDPLMNGGMDQCPATQQCVGNNCCLEDQLLCATFGCPPGTCVDMTPCQTSVTPQ